MSRIGDSNVLFGCTDEGWGFVQNMTVDDSVDMAEGQNGQGNVVVAELYNQKKRCSGEYIYRNGSGDPVSLIGTNTAITFTDALFGTVSFYITSASQAKRLGDWLKVSFEGMYWPNLGS